MTSICNRRNSLSSALRVALLGLVSGKASPYTFAQCDSQSLELCFSLSGIPVYRIGRGTPVVLLHELNGMSPSCLTLGRMLAAEGFAVYLPLLFGHICQDNVILGAIEACAVGSFSCFRTGTAGRELKYFRQICDRVAETSKAPKLGVVGMCLTGSLPLGVMGNPRVKAVVLSQPALPFGFTGHARAATGVSRADLESARISATPVLAFRFEADTLCRHERIEAIEAALAPNQLRLHEFASPPMQEPYSHRLHAVLTAGIEPAASEAFSEMVRFLTANLR
jgi:dienelactone hydrolase